MTQVYFFHGAFSSPQSTKIQYLKRLAEARRFSIIIPDQSAITSPDDRVQQMLQYDFPQDDELVLVGSSMGGYVATVLSAHVKPKGLFLMAPAVFMDNYQNHDLVPHAQQVSIVHGWHDDVIPLPNVLHFAEQNNADLHILDGKHNLRENISTIGVIFDHFLNDLFNKKNLN